MENLPAWDLTTVYPELVSDKFKADEIRFAQVIDEINVLASGLPQRPIPETASSAKIFQIYYGLLNEGLILHHDLMSFVYALTAVDAKDADVLSKISQLEVVSSKFHQATLSFDLALMNVSESFVERVLEDPTTAKFRFWIRERRQQADIQLPESEEKLIAALSPSGLSAWGNLYTQITGNMQMAVTIKGKEQKLGVAQAQGLLGSAVEGDRKAGWQALQDGWKQNEVAAAAGLNAMAGWRLELIRRRSHTRQVDFLTQPLSQSKITRETLDAMMSATWNNVERTRNIYRRMASVHGKKKLDPWDLLAPAPLKEKGELSYEGALKLVEEAFTSVDPEMGEFVRTMKKNNWLEGRILPNKSGGAFCTHFAKACTPRVFQTFMGNAKDLTTMAHEIGHGFHFWALRDLSFAEQNYPMTLAETASIFSETLLTHYLREKSTDTRIVTEANFAEMEHAAGLLINIPARFEFEAEFHRRREVSALSAEELRKLNDEIWTKWYGDTLSVNDNMYWATKLHFHISDVTFYNFPYTFGYLFGLSIYARREELGSQFFKKYVAILRDTGRMSAEDLVRKHLDEDIRDEKFWQKAIDVGLASGELPLVLG